MRYKDIFKNEDKEVIRNLLYKYIDITNFDSFLFYLKSNNSKYLAFFNEVKDNLIDLYKNKNPLIFDISDDDIINITGETGSGKSTYTLKHYNDLDKYEVIETDKLFNESFEVDKFQLQIRNKIFNKYQDEHYPGGYNLRINFNHFNDVLKIIVNSKKKTNKCLVIDSGQYRHLKNYKLLKGKLIIIRTSVDLSIKRACMRFKKRYPNATKEEIKNHKIKKYTAFELHKKFNTLIIKSFILYRF
jgi:hypothetical protein